MAFKRSAVQFHGESGTEYPFNVWPLEHAFTTSGAVYAVTRRFYNEGTYKHDVIYIGQARNLSTQFDNHRKIDCFTKRNANCICTHEDKSEGSRLVKKDDLIKKYKPHCND